MTLEETEIGSQVTIRVTDCLYACCGGGWRGRPYETTYEGRVTGKAGDYLILQGRALGTTFQLVAERAKILDITPAGE